MFESRIPDPIIQLQPALYPAGYLAAGGRVRVWNLPARLVHWGLAIPVGIAWVTHHGPP